MRFEKATDFVADRFIHETADGRRFLVNRKVGEASNVPPLPVIGSGNPSPNPRACTGDSVWLSEYVNDKRALEVKFSSIFSAGERVMRVPRKGFR